MAKVRADDTAASTCSVMVPAAGPGAIGLSLLVDLRSWVTPKQRVLSGTQHVVVPGEVTWQHAPEPTLGLAPLGPAHANVVVR